ncbi:histidine--tRNA ligase [Acidianus ambivalens]|uniref:Histidine--tRNA ligase n=1 Tax=Acidianus ambivalens TaxID=2283 RepID=A0A650CXQ5_ACIAM|nr:histidine--tRNA ligase [Acidianus ambivalens]MQL54794.1 histidine--tRNA ligase [Acidianus ambivalens]QGR22586.1 histidine--tRNA ligase [Acidianus ambivalens]
MVSYEPLRGMKDYFGEDAEKIRYIEDQFSKIVKKSGYIEAITPILEEFELFALKGGEELRNTMYTFVDKGGREVALRPEFTPSIVRLFLNSMQHLPKPIRLYYIGTVYRYDEPQFGRYREFRQAGIEMLGESSINADLEVLSILWEFFKKINLENITIKINNIAIYRELFSMLKMSEDQEDHLLHLIDKGNKDSVIEYLSKISEYKILNIIREMLYNSISKESDFIELIKDLNNERSKVLENQISRLFKIYEILAKLNVPIKIDLSLVRGLAYYTGVIFEVAHPSVSFSIAGGGRYDNLVQLYGGPSTPSIGFAIGVERVLSVLQNLKIKDNFRKIAIIPLNENVIDYALKVLFILHENDIPAILNTKNISLSKIIPNLLDMNINIAIIIGENEKMENKVSIKDLTTRQQSSISLNELLSYIRQII